MSIYISKLLPLSLLCTTISATCYYPDGSPITPDNHPPNVNSTDYQPCDSDTSSFSMCCATNRLVKGDTCMSNGICHNGYGEYWRESCTDPTWNSPFCLKNICANASSGDKPYSDNQMSLCEEDGSWCCGLFSSQDCCATKNRIFLPTTIGISSPSSASAAASMSSSSSSSTLIPSQSSTSSLSLSLTSSFSSSTSIVDTFTPQTNPTATGLLTVIPSALVLSPSGQTSVPPASGSSSDANRNSQDTTSIRIGIGVGIGSGLLLILLTIILFLVMKLRRARKREAQEIETSSGDVKSSSVYEPTEPGQDASLHEVYMLDGSKEDHDFLYGVFHKPELGSVDELTRRSELSTERGIYMMSAKREAQEVQGSIP